MKPSPECALSCAAPLVSNPLWPSLSLPRCHSLALSATAQAVLPPGSPPTPPWPITVLGPSGCSQIQPSECHLHPHLHHFPGLPPLEFLRSRGWGLCTAHCGAGLANSGHSAAVWRDSLISSSNQQRGGCLPPQPHLYFLRSDWAQNLETWDLKRKKKARGLAESWIRSPGGAGLETYASKDVKCDSLATSYGDFLLRRGNKDAYNS